MQFTRREINFICIFILFFLMFSCVNMYALMLPYERALPDVDAEKVVSHMTSMCVPPDTDKNERFEPSPDIHIRVSRTGGFLSGLLSDKGFLCNTKEYSDKNISIKEGEGFKSLGVMRC